jgi:YYY domain-containing protein
MSFLAWLIAMLGISPFNGPLLIVSALAVALIGWWLARGRRLDPGAELRHIGFVLVPGWRTIAFYEAVFLAALLFVAWMRSYDAVPWGTERPMDFAFFNAIQRSPSFPPNDPWLAGYSINYYYFGYLMMAAVAMLSGAAPAVGYNLSLALTFALTALGIVGLILNLCRLQFVENSADVASSPRALRLAPLFAVLGVVFVLMSANQMGALQLILGDERVVALDGRQLASALAQRASGAETITLPHTVNVQDFNELSGWERRAMAEQFNWWWPSRALWDDYPELSPPNRRYNITEFPFFSFRLGDMHPHVMALPFGLLALALCLNTVARRAAPAFAMNARGWAELILSSIVIGSLYAINSWDLPTYFLLYAGAMLLLYLRLAEGGQVIWMQLGQQIASVAVLAFVLFAPFQLTFTSPAGAAEPLIDLPIIGRLTEIIAPYSGGPSNLHAFLLIFGLFVVPLVAFVYLGRDFRSQESGVGRGDVPQRVPSADALGIVARGQFFALQDVLPLLPWLPPILLVAGLLIGFPLLGLLGFGIFAFVSALRQNEKPATAFTLLATALGCAVAFGVDLVYIRDLFGNRMNTVFKFYYQLWLIWGTLAAYALWWLLTQRSSAARLVGTGVSSIAAVLLVGSLVYPWLVVGQLREGTAGTLDGRTPRELSDAGRASIEWLRRNAPAGSVVLEMAERTAADGRGVGGSYNGEGYSGVSAATGLPTVIGWVWHETQWRIGDEELSAQLSLRRDEVDRIYSTLDANEARELLAKYGVHYVYIGGLERQNYSAESLAKFSELGDPVFEQDDVAIYTLKP